MILFLMNQHHSFNDIMIYNSMKAIIAGCLKKRRFRTNVILRVSSFRLFQKLERETS